MGKSRAKTFLYFVLGFVGILTVALVIYNINISKAKNDILMSNEVVEINLDNDLRNKATLSINKGEFYADKGGGVTGFVVVPQIAIWIEDEKGNYIKDVYVTPKISKINRASALPVWANKSKDMNIDGISSATPRSDFNIHVDIPVDIETYSVLLEVNNSYDYNDYYTDNSTKGSDGYNTDYCGQPALIYRAQVDGSSSEYKFELIGHSSPTGEDGKIYDDLSHITTADKIIKEATISFKVD